MRGEGVERDGHQSGVNTFISLSVFNGTYTWKPQKSCLTTRIFLKVLTSPVTPGSVCTATGGLPLVPHLSLDAWSVPTREASFGCGEAEEEEEEEEDQTIGSNTNDVSTDTHGQLLLKWVDVLVRT